MLVVIDASVHMHAAILACVSLDDRLGVHRGKFVSIRAYLEVVPRHHRHLREQRAGRFPALGATAYMVVGALAFDRHRNFFVRALTYQGPTCRSEEHTSELQS